jgi:proteasome lid subunit RPN8/RPN11
MVGWYHTGPKLRSSDLEINELFKRYVPNPVLVIIDVKPKDLGLPTDAYFAVEEIHDVSFVAIVLAMTFGQSSYTSFFDNDQIACRNQRLLT